jgi:hypothetical protein
MDDKFERLNIDLFRYLWNTEVLYQNRLVCLQNDFVKFKVHTLDDYQRLYIAELEFKLFKRLSSDIELLLRGY